MLKESRRILSTVYVEKRKMTQLTSRKRRHLSLFTSGFASESVIKVKIVFYTAKLYREK